MLNSMHTFKKHILSHSVVALAAFVCLQPVHAELIATPLRGDSRLVQFHYDADNTYLVLSKPKAVTHIQLAADEVITSIAAGDTSAWELTPTKNRKHLFVKPKFEDIDTSMTILTDKRTYQFVLRSTGDGKKWYQRVSWMYDTEMVLDEDPVIKAAVSEGPSKPSADEKQANASTNSTDLCAANGTGIRPDALRFRYEIKGEAAFKPQVVFDDGRFTYFRMPESLQELPALFAVIDGNDYSLVNYTVQCQFLVAQRLMDASVLKLGRNEVRINQIQPKRSFFGRVEN